MSQVTRIFAVKMTNSKSHNQQLHPHHEIPIPSSNYFPVYLPLSLLSIAQWQARALLSTVTSAAPTTEIPWSTRIRNAYDALETDGILALAQSMGNLPSCTTLVDASLQAYPDNKGVTASILNAWIASCSLMEDPVVGAAYARDLLHAFTEISTTQGIQPDSLTHCFAYSALLRGHYQQEATHVLETAARLTKKACGSQRRKQMAAMRRTSAANALDQQAQLQAYLGNECYILHETQDYVAMCKPASVACHHTTMTSKGTRIQSAGGDASVVDALRQVHVPLSTLNPESLGLVHRLDRGTSGCLLLAKTNAFHAQCVTEFFLRRTHKMYTAIIGPVPIDIPDTGTMASPVGGRPARSHYRIVQRYENHATHVQVTTETGRRHQVRVHCRDALSPIVGDAVYGHSNNKASQGSERFCLHASSLQIPALQVNVSAPVPTWWTSTLQSLCRDADL
jgi:23S rRNA-/tRNA-specific pseudouridylate synthase